METSAERSLGHQLYCIFDSQLIPFFGLLPGSQPCLPPSDRLICVHLASPGKLALQGFELINLPSVLMGQQKAHLLFSPLGGVCSGA